MNWVFIKVLALLNLVDQISCLYLGNMGVGTGQPLEQLSNSLKVWLL